MYVLTNLLLNFPFTSVTYFISKHVTYLCPTPDFRSYSLNILTYWGMAFLRICLPYSQKILVF
jgi:hypothetical protein